MRKGTVPLFCHLVRVVGFEGLQGLLIDIRDKLLFEPEFSGDVKEHVPPKSSLILPWQWLPAAMSLLQEVGEEKIVMDIGRAVRQQPNAKPYIHDILLSMALVECSIARRGFERGTVSGGFEALARAQLLLRSKRSLAKLTLLTEVHSIILSLYAFFPRTLDVIGIFLNAID